MSDKPKLIRPGMTHEGDLAWVVTNGHYVPGWSTVQAIESGAYCVGFDNSFGEYLKKIELNSEPLVSDGNSFVELMAYINKFWDSEKIFKEHRMSYKRGIMMYGPPGTGKSCIMKAIAIRMIERGGVSIVLNCDTEHITNIVNILQKLRETEPDRHLLICMEDIEACIKRGYEATLINLIDGASSIDNVVYVATTNYIDALPSRLTRPSRFDNIVEIPPPDAATRWNYLQHLSEGNGFTIPKSWKDGTADMTYAELKELFISVVVFGRTFADVKARFKKELGRKELA